MKKHNKVSRMLWQFVALFGFLLLLWGCGSSSTPGSASGQSGVVVDPYIVGAELSEYLADGSLREGQVSTLSNEQGGFTFPQAVLPDSTIVMTGQGFHNGVPFYGTLKSKANLIDGQLVISPISTLIANLVEGGLSEEQAQAQVQQMLVSSGLNLTTGELLENPMLSANGGDLSILKANMAVNGLLRALEKSGEEGFLVGQNSDYTAHLQSRQEVLTLLAESIEQTLSDAARQQLHSNVQSRLGRTLFDVYAISEDDLIRTTVAATDFVADMAAADLRQDGNLDLSVDLLLNETTLTELALRHYTARNIGQRAFRDSYQQSQLNDSTLPEVRSGETYSLDESGAVEVASSPGNSVPLADAGADQSVGTGSIVTLDGSGSSDADQDLLSYRWVLILAPQGSQAQIENETHVRSNFTPDKDGVYVFRMLAHDGKVGSVPAMTLVRAATFNVAPVADAGVAQNVSTGSLVTLDASGSSDGNEDLLSYDWSFRSVPGDSDLAGTDLIGATTVVPSFTPDADGDYVLQLIVSDGSLESRPSNITVTAATSNSAPVASAGADQYARVGRLATIDGNTSSDADGDPLNYSWAFVSIAPGSTLGNLDLSSTGAKSPTFTPDVRGVYVLRLIVSDGEMDSAPDTVTVNALDWVHPGSLDGHISPDGERARYPRVAMDAEGNAIVVWQQGIGGRERIFMSERDGVTGGWTHPVDNFDVVCDFLGVGRDPQVAMNAHGDAILVWYQFEPNFNGSIFMSERDGATGTWTHPSSFADKISPDGQRASKPKVAIDDNGNAIIAWYQHDTDNIFQIFKSERDGATGTWTHPTDPSDNISPNGQAAAMPEVAMDNNGNAVIVWRQSDGSFSQVFMSERDNRLGHWTHPVDLSDYISLAGTISSYPQVAMDTAGNAVVVWNENNNTNLEIHLSQKVGATGAWSHPAGLNDKVSPEGGRAWPTHTAMDANGNAIVVWYQYDTANILQIFKSEKDGATGAWSHPTDLTDNISPYGQPAFMPQVAMVANGNAVVVWYQSDGSFNRVYMSERDGTTGNWKHPDLTDKINPGGGNGYTYPQVAMDANGNAIIVWTESDGSADQVYMSEVR